MTDPGQTGTSVPIGRPIANTDVYLLDREVNPVPIGVAGELYIGGDGLARNYLNRPGLTAENFVPNPFSDEPGKRLYKTGDLVRYLPDGNIEFLGRQDYQVKIRGFRIELGEIEAVLGQHPGVLETTVLAREDVPDDKRLVAYVVASHEPTPSFSELRSFLKEKLPDYMIPSAFVFLDAFPITPNGKVDRHALPVPDGTRPELDRGFVAPRTPVEEVLAEIWGKMLGVEKVGIHDNFFELGGHSLIATQILSAICDAFRVELTLHHFFETLTIAGLSESIEEAKNSGSTLQTPAITPISRKSRTRLPK
jgi:acyl carrier protein